MIPDIITLPMLALSHVAGTLVVLGLTFISLTLPRDRFPIGSFIALVGAIFVAVGL